MTHLLVFLLIFVAPSFAQVKGGNGVVQYDYGLSKTLSPEEIMRFTGEVGILNEVGETIRKHFIDRLKECNRSYFLSNYKMKNYTNNDVLRSTLTLLKLTDQTTSSLPDSTCGIGVGQCIITPEVMEALKNLDEIDLDKLAKNLHSLNLSGPQKNESNELIFLLIEIRKLGKN